MTTIKVQGMKCKHCVNTVTKALEALDGVDHVRVDLENGQASFDGSPDLEKVRAAITAKGFVLVE